MVLPLSVPVDGEEAAHSQHTAKLSCKPNLLQALHLTWFSGS